MRMLRDYSLATCDILYRFPDYPLLLQHMIWQEFDEAPIFPRVRKFLKYWEENIEGKLVGVTIAHSSLIKPIDYRILEGSFEIN